MSSFIVRSTFIALLCCTLCLPSTQSARILGFFPVPSKSNIIIHCALAEALGKAGHDVTVISNFPDPYRGAPYKFIHIDVPLMDSDYITETIKTQPPIYVAFKKLSSEMMKMSENLLIHPQTQEFLKSHGENSFDLLMMAYFLNDFHIGLAAHFKCPVVLSFGVAPFGMVNKIVGNPLEVSYMPNLMGKMKQPMNFMERVKNFVFTAFEQAVMLPLMQSKQEALYNHYFAADRYPPFSKALRNVSLIFVNHHSISQGPIRPYVPTLIEIGGIQIKEKTAPLPADIAHVLKNAPQGVIYFSFGSVTQGNNLAPEKAKMFFNVLSKLPQKVLWKWSNATEPGQAPNIVYKSWLPQDDILAHPNVKLFITHAGKGSVVESQYHGVPMVAIPLFGDQPSNAERMERDGYGLRLDYTTMTEESLRKAIEEVLNNAKYSNEVKALATLYRDRPMTARQTVVYWVEYVLRHRGAAHLQSPAVHMNFWQLHSLDVMGFLGLIFMAVVLAIVFGYRIVSGCCKERKIYYALTKMNVTEEAVKGKKSKAKKRQ